MGGELHLVVDIVPTQGRGQTVACRGRTLEVADVQPEVLLLGGDVESGVLGVEGVAGPAGHVHTEGEDFGEV